MKTIVMAKKFRYILALVALVGCTAAFAADGTADTAQTNQSQSQYTCSYHQDCPYGDGRGHHHHCGYCHQNDAQTVTQQ
jgi:hypothetical protein